MEARYLGHHARTGAMIGMTADGIVCGRLGRRLPEAERWDQTGWHDLKGLPWDLRPTGVPAPEVDVEAQPGAAEAEQRERRWQSKPRERAGPARLRDEAPQGGVQKQRAAAALALASDAAETVLTATRARGREFYVLKKEVDRFGQTAGCTACTDASLEISGRHAHNDDGVVVVGWLGRGTTTLHCTHSASPHSTRHQRIFSFPGDDSALLGSEGMTLNCFHVCVSLPSVDVNAVLDGALFCRSQR